MRQAAKALAPATSDANLLYGVKAIAAFLGVTPRQALGLIERGHLTHFHVGKIVCARRSTLTAWLSRFPLVDQRTCCAVRCGP